MTTLVFGVIDVPYENEGAKPKKKPKRGQGSKNPAPTTTVQVAEILEEKYGVMQAFYDARKNDITQHMIESAEGALETLFMGGPVDDLFAEASQGIQADFRTFLMTAEIETMGIPGVPTKAAQERRSLRFKAKVGPNSRPSFIDTGTYELAFRGWVE
jgi:hypothetical protein